MDFHFSHEIIQIENHILDSRLDLALDLIEEVELKYSMVGIEYNQAQNLKAECLLYQNKPREAINYLELSDQLNNGNNLYITLDVILLKLEAFSMLREYENTLPLLRKFEKLINKVELPLIQDNFRSKVFRINGLQDLENNDYANAIKNFEKSIELGKYYADRGEIVNLLNLLSISYHRSLKYDKAIEILNEARNYANKENLPKLRINAIITNLGGLYQKKGDLIKAEKSFLKVLEYFESLDQPGIASGIYKNLGELFYHYGKINKAINFTKKSIESFRIMDHQGGVMASQILLAKIKYISNEVNSAISILDEIFVYNDKYVNTLLIYEVVLFRVLIFCRTDNKRPIENYLTFFDETKGSQITASVKVVVELIDAILSLSKPGIRSKAAALVKLEWIFNQDEVNFEYKNYSIRLLIEILLTDYKESLSHEIFEQIIQYLSLLEESSEKQKLLPTLIETMIIRSKFLVIQGKFQESDTILTDAIILADKYKLETLNKQIIFEKSRLVDEFQRLKSFVDVNYEFLDDIEKQEFNNYLDTIRRFRVKLEG